MTLEQFIADYYETRNIKQWRIDNKIEVNAEYLAKITKRDIMQEKLIQYAAIGAFILGAVVMTI